MTEPRKDDNGEEFVHRQPDTIILTFWQLCLILSGLVGAGIVIPVFVYWIFTGAWWP